MLVVGVALIAGCTHPRTPPSVVVDDITASGPPLITAVTNALEKSRTFLELKNRAQMPMVVVDDETNGWVTVEIGNLSEQLFHRWATLKIERTSGAIIRLGTDSNLEDKWLVEYQPKK